MTTNRAGLVVGGLIAASWLLSGCGESIARGMFEAKHEDCDDETTLRDADGSIHVMGCGHVEKYHCTTRSVVVGTHYEASPTNVGYPASTSYSTSSGSLYNPTGRGRYDVTTPPPRPTDFRSGYDASGQGKMVTDYSSVTDCTEDGADAPAREPPPKYLAPPPDAPPVEIRSEKGRIGLRLELLLSHSALLTMTASPDQNADELVFRLSHRELDSEKEGCELRFAINDQPFGIPAASVKRTDAVLARVVRIGGERLASFDRIKRLTIEVCDKRWALNRAQILRLRELMALLRREAAKRQPEPPASPATEGEGKAPLSPP